MKLIIDIPVAQYEICRDNEYCDMSDYSKLAMLSYLAQIVKTGIPFGLDLPTFKEEFHCTACVHYVHRDVPSIFCENCQYKEEMLRRINNE